MKRYPKILLLALPSDTRNPRNNLLLLQPLGLLGISAVLKQHGFDVTLLDAAGLYMNHDAIVEYIKETKPDVIAQTLYTFQLEQTMDILREVKPALPETRIVMGGAHPSVEGPGLLETYSEIDVSVIGEGERTMLELMTAWADGTSLDDVDGIAYRDGDQVRKTEKRAFIDDLDELPMNDWAPLPMDKYWYNWTVKKNYAAVTFSRGCPFSCIFCAKEVTGRKQRKRSPGKIVEEIKTLYDTYGVRNMLIADSIFNLNKEWVRDICKGMIALNRPVLWGAQIRADMVDPDTMDLMKRSGCHKLFIGVESGDPRMLKAMRKGESLDDIREGIRIMSSAGINPDLGFIIGLPGETPESARRTIEFAREFPKCQSAFNLAMPYPGTAFYEIAATEGFHVSNWSDISTYYDLSYTPESMEGDELQRLYKKAVKEAYLRPSFLLGQIRQLRSWTNFKIKLWMAFQIFGKRFAKLAVQAAKRK